MAGLAMLKHTFRRGFVRSLGGEPVLPVLHGRFRIMEPRLGLRGRHVALAPPDPVVGPCYHLAASSCRSNWESSQLWRAPFLGGRHMCDSTHIFIRHTALHVRSLAWPRLVLDSYTISGISEQYWVNRPP
jgi:hypothetical protein